MLSDSDITENVEKIENWEDDNQKAVGNIMLRLAPQIQGNLTSETMDSAGLLWDHLEKQYGKPGIIATYLEFKAAMDIKINDNEDPTTAIDKMTVHFTRCNSSGLEVPDHFQAMLIMVKLPSAFDGLTQIFCQKDSVKNLDVADMRRPSVLPGNKGKEPRSPKTKLRSSALSSADLMSHPLNNNRVMVNRVVVVAEETVLGVAGTSKAQETRPSPPSRHNLRLVPLNHLFLFPRLPPSTLSSLVTSHPPSSRSPLRCPHHSTRALTKLCLSRGGLESH